MICSVSQNTNGPMMTAETFHTARAAGLAAEWRQS